MESKNYHGRAIRFKVMIEVDDEEGPERLIDGRTKRGGQPRSWPFSFVSPSYDHPDKDDVKR
jgi:hypothetical protein